MTPPLSKAKQTSIICLAVLIALGQATEAQDRRTKVLADRISIEADGHWIYNDLGKGIDEAKRTGKPILIIIRCIPCQACAQLDADVAERHPLVRPLLDQFVCVRIVQANGLDLSLFQYDYDQSFAAFFMNSDKTIYGRYGTRSHETESVQDVSLEGFVDSLEAALELHKNYPANRGALIGKTKAPPPEFLVPEQSEMLAGKYGSKLDYQGKVVESCIHCHQVGEAKRYHYRSLRLPIPEQVLFPYPNPKILGLMMNPLVAGAVKVVLPESAAARGGFQAGDQIKTLAGQPILSTADVQWVLHNFRDMGEIEAEISRGGEFMKLGLRLEPGWRRRDDISWRATSWDLRRMVSGGMVLEDLASDERRQTGLDDGSLALQVKYLGEYGEHAAGKQAGFKKGDVIVRAGDRQDRMTESDYLAYAANTKPAGEKMAMQVLRDGKKLEIDLPMR